MSLQYEFTEHSAYLRCAVSGEHDSPLDYNVPIRETLRKCRNSEHRQALIDYRLVTAYPDPSARIALLNDFTEIYESYLNFGGNPLRFAFVVGTAYDGNEVVGNVAKDIKVANNLKLELIQTLDIDEAIAWLREPTNSAQ